MVLDGFKEENFLKPIHGLLSLFLLFIIFFLFQAISWNDKLLWTLLQVQENQQKLMKKNILKSQTPSRSPVIPFIPVIIPFTNFIY